MHTTEHAKVTTRYRVVRGLLLTLLGTIAVPSAIAAPSETITIVAFGDSTTARRGNLVVYASLLGEELSSTGVANRIVNAGIGGNNTEQARRRFETAVLARDPDIAIIQFGINDSAVDVWRKPPATEPRIAIERYASNLRHFVRTLKSRGTRAVLMTPNPMRWTPKLRQLYGMPPYKPQDENGFNVLLTNYAAVVREISQEENVAIVDVFAAFECFGRKPGQSVNDLLLDGMHPNSRGHKIVATLLLAELAREDRGAKSNE